MRHGENIYTIASRNLAEQNPALDVELIKRWNSSTSEGTRMKNKILKNLALGLVQITLLSTVACGPKLQEDTNSASSVSVDSSVAPVEASIGAGMTLVSGIADDQNVRTLRQINPTIDH
jgi:hypothetical protein